MADAERAGEGGEEDAAESECVGSRDTSSTEQKGASLSAAARARAERNRLRARTLRDARLVRPERHGQPVQTAQHGQHLCGAGRDTGGGFLLEADEEPEPVRAAPAPAPHVHVAEQPHCLECGRPFPQSYLYDTFDYSVCDACRDEEAHSLVTRTEAKSEYLLQDCDLDSRPPALRCVRRRNPHAARGAAMRLYLRAQVQARALLVWGDAQRLEEERARRRARAERARATQERRRLRALRMDVRSELFRRVEPRHEHEFGAETRQPERDLYTRACRHCAHVETYEKM